MGLSRGLSRGLTERQREIYQRQMQLSELGAEGQEALCARSVLVCGCGGLGSPALMYLAAMGIGRLGLVDGDSVAWSNLNRQLLYGPADVGRMKVEAAAERLRQLNSETVLEPHPLYLTADNARERISGYDLVLDCLDDFPARFVLNDACLELNIPFVHGGVYGLQGQTLTVVPGRTPCLRCLFPEGDVEQSAGFKGIIGPTAGVIASLQVTEVFKLLTGGQPNPGLLLYDGRIPETRLLHLEPLPDCLCRRCPT